MGLAGGLATEGLLAGGLGGIGSGVAPVIDIRASPYNAVLDRQAVSDGNMTNGSAVLTTTTSAPFALTDIGKAISVRGAGSNPGLELRTTISGFTSSSSVTLAANATKTVASRTVADGTTTAGSATLTSATAAFVSTDVGSPITCDGVPANTVIQAFTNATTVTMSQNAMASVAGTGTLAIFNGVRWGTDLNNNAATGILNTALKALNLTGGTILIPGFAVATQAIRIGTDGAVSAATIILDFQGAGGIDFINSNTTGFLETTGSNAASRIPRLVVRNFQFDLCYAGYGTDGLFNRVATGALDQLPYPFFTLKGQTGYPAGASTVIGTFGTSTGTTAISLTDSGAAWTLNQWVGARVFIDEDKATANSNVGSGYMTIAGNTPTMVWGYGWTGTKQTIAYVPSGAAVRYRIHTDVFRGALHLWENGLVLRPSAFVSFPNRSRWVDVTIEGAGQGGATVHTDTFGGGGCRNDIVRVTRKNCWGAMGDYAATIPGLFAEPFIDGYDNVGQGNQSSLLLVAGVGARIMGVKGDNNVVGSGIGYDAITHQANRGKNVITGCEIPSLTIDNSGLQALYLDQVPGGGNLAQDSPWFQGNGTNTAPTAITFVSGTGQQVDVLRDTFIWIPITYSPTAGAAATCIVAISYDGGTTYTNLATAQIPAGVALDNIIMPVQLYVQGGAFIKITVANATIAAGSVVY